MDKNVLITMTILLKDIVKEKGGNVEFAESVTIIGQYGDRAGAKRFFIKNDELCAHVYNCWMENKCASLEYSLLSEETLRMLINRIENSL